CSGSRRRTRACRPRRSTPCAEETPPTTPPPCARCCRPFAAPCPGDRLSGHGMDRVGIEDLGHGFYRMVIHIGFMDEA
ncbi:hypothetical protein ABTM84_19695, partial [Acinetobacter baumannii]